MAVNSVMTNFVKQNFKAQGKKHVPFPTHLNNVKQTKSNKVEKGITVEKKPESLWNEKTEAYLKKLTEKYGNVNFVIGDPNDPNVPKDTGGKQYNCYISLDLLAQMAADDKVAEKYEGIIDDALKQVDDLKQQVEDKGLQKFVKNYSVKVNSDGTVDYMVALKGSLKGLHDRCKNCKDKPKTLKADNIGSLVKALEDYSKGKAPKHGAKFKAFSKHNHHGHHGHHGKIGMFAKQPVGMFMIQPFVLLRPVVFINQINIIQGHKHPPKQFYQCAQLNINKTYTAKHMSKIMGGLKHTQKHGHHAPQKAKSHHGHNSHHAKNTYVPKHGNPHHNPHAKQVNGGFFTIGSYDVNGVKRMDFPFLVSSDGRVGPQTVTAHVGFLGISYHQPVKGNPANVKSYGPVNTIAVKSITISGGFYVPPLPYHGLKAPDVKGKASAGLNVQA